MWIKSSTYLHFDIYIVTTLEYCQVSRQRGRALVLEALCSIGKRAEHPIDYDERTSMSMSGGVGCRGEAIRLFTLEVIHIINIINISTIGIYSIVK